MSTLSQPTSTSDSARESSTLHQFPQFSFLPTELRLKIWSYIIPCSRTITINCEKAVTSKTQPRRYAKRFTTSTHPPITLQICRESREVGVACYKKLFQTPTSDSYIYIDPEEDTVFMIDSNLAYLGTAELGGLHKVNVKVSDYTYFGHYNMDKIMQMIGLRSLDITTEDDVDCMIQNGVVTTYCVIQSRVVTASAPVYPSWPVIRGFLEAKLEDPGWSSPDIRILDKNGNALYALDGGALISGWKAGDPIPDDLAQQALPLYFSG